MLSTQLLGGYLSQPYAWFLNRHSADLGKAVLSEVDNVVSQSFVPGMSFLANLVVAGFISVFLIALQPIIALATTVVLVASYALIFMVARKYLTRFGEIRFAANAERYKIAQEATAGIKDVKLLGLEARYVRRFRQPARRMARVGSARTVIAQAPRYLLQGVAFGGMLLIILGMLIGAERLARHHPAAARGLCLRRPQAAAGGAAGLPGGHLDALQPAGAGVAAQGHHGHPRPRRRAGRDRAPSRCRCATGSS